VRQIAKSIASFGFNVPVLVDAEQSVIAGHGRVLAAKELGWDEVPVIALEHIDAAQRRAFAIADNRLTENAAWDGSLSCSANSRRNGGSQCDAAAADPRFSRAACWRSDIRRLCVLRTCSCGVVAAPGPRAWR
jgi:hypothetical protein